MFGFINWVVKGKMVIVKRYKSLPVANLLLTVCFELYLWDLRHLRWQSEVFFVVPGLGRFSLKMGIDFKPFSSKNSDKAMNFRGQV